MCNCKYIAIQGHDRSCPSLRTEYDRMNSERLFKSGQFRPVHRQRTWHPLRIGRNRRRAQVRTSRITKSGAVDRRYNWRDA